MQRGAKETDSEMLPQDPPPWFVRSTALAADRDVRRCAARGGPRETAGDGHLSIHPCAGGWCGSRFSLLAWRLSARSSVTIEGRIVKGGDPLYVLRSDEIRGWGTDLQTLGEDLHTHQEGLAKADAAYASAAGNQEGGNFAGGKRSGISRKARRRAVASCSRAWKNCRRTAVFRRSRCCNIDSMPRNQRKT